VSVLLYWGNWKEQKSKQKAVEKAVTESSRERNDSISKGLTQLIVAYHIGTSNVA